MRVLALLRRRHFPTLYLTRVTAQAADGIFQASLASAVFFNPDHQTDPTQAAAGFVVLLLPYSLVGPFAGVFLDHWRRQQVLVRANWIRAVFVVVTAALLLAHGPRDVPFYLAALAALSVNRFYLAALSTSLPRVVGRDELVLANAVTTTSGSLVSALGVGVGLAIRHFAGDGDHGAAVVALSSVAGYVAAATIAARIPRDTLGPLHPSQAPLTRELGQVSRGLAAGARHVHERPGVRRALAAISATRVLFGLSTIGTLLLYRNYFTDQGVLRSGVVGLGQAVAAATVGYVAAAMLTPGVARHIGKPAWIATCYFGAGLAQLAGGLPFRMLPLLCGAAAIGFASAGAKICVDTIVQEQIDDEYRGRVFSFYDTLFNVTFVVAAVVAAFTLPADGRSTSMVLALTAGYLITAAGYALSEARATRVNAGVSAPAQA